MLRVPLTACGVYNIILRQLNIFTDFFDICHKQMLIYNKSNLDNFLSRSVWITSSVSLVYEQPSYYAMPSIQTTIIKKTILMLYLLKSGGKFVDSTKVNKPTGMI